MYLLFFLLWVILNGRVTLEICLFGIVIAAAVFAFTCRFMDYSIKQEKKNCRKVFDFLKYAFVLVKGVMKANFTVIHMVLSEKEEIEPVLVSFESDMKTPTGKAFLANAITLTPGTITVSLRDSEYVVHCLDESLAEGIQNSDLAEILKKIEQD